MQEQERIANEEAEKQLKAALTAKREAVAASRVASPALNNISLDSVEVKPPVEEKQEDVAMEVEPVPAASTAQAPEVSQTRTLCHSKLIHSQSPWLPELSALFDDIKKIAPGNAYEVIG